MNFSSPQAGILLIGGVALVLPVVLVAANIWSRWQRHRTRQLEADRDSVESSTTYRRYLVAAASTDGSGRSWDRSIRPVLAELVESVMVEQRSGCSDPNVFARDSLGEDLWQLIYRPQPRWRACAGGHADRRALLEILDKLERSTSSPGRFMG